MNRTYLLLAALLAGMLIGLGVRLDGNPTLAAIVAGAAPVGTLWVRALQMTLVPLIFALVASGVAAAVKAGGGGGLSGGTVLAFVGLLAVAASLAGLETRLVIAVWPLPDHALAGLPFAATAPPAMPGLAEQLMNIIPINPVAAAASGQMLPLAVFAVAFGFATTRVAAGPGGGVAALLGEIAQTMMVMVEWVLWFAPLGIVVLALGAANSAGTGLASLLVHYVATLIGFGILALALCYLAIAVFRPAPFWRFARGIVGPQAVAAGTTSSTACLPAMLDAAIFGLGLEPRIASLILPLAVTSFRFAAAAAVMIGVTLSAYAAGVEPSLGQYAVTAAICVLVSLGSVGLPGAAVIYASYAPGFGFYGVPLELIPLLIAVYALPDIFITMANVTVDLTLTTFIARSAQFAPRDSRSRVGAASGRLR